jgi:hypothetical protein
MLGVRREAVSQQAAHLQDAGLIRYHRGHIAILDRAGLEARACECYGVVRRDVERLARLGRVAKARVLCAAPHRPGHGALIQSSIVSTNKLTPDRTGPQPD